MRQTIHGTDAKRVNAVGDVTVYQLPIGKYVATYRGFTVLGAYDTYEQALHWGQCRAKTTPATIRPVVGQVRKWRRKGLIPPCPDDIGFDRDLPTMRPGVLAELRAG